MKRFSNVAQINSQRVKKLLRGRAITGMTEHSRRVVQKNSPGSDETKKYVIINMAAPAENIAITLERIGEPNEAAELLRVHPAGQLMLVRTIVVPA